MTKIKIAIKHFLTGSIIFEYESENNTLVQTVQQAVILKKDLTGADLRGAYLRGADLRGADLRGAYLTSAYLRGADLTGAYLTGADLRGADLTGAYLRGAYLTGAYLRGADLRGAYLTGAYLRGADLRGADLRGADLRGAYLRGADLTGAYLTGAYLTGAYLTGAYLRGNEKIQKVAVFTGLYEYIVIPYITEAGEKRVKMGCQNRSLAEWEADFWNNNNEFPNDGSDSSQMRLMAFNTAVSWFGIASPQNQ